MRRYNTKNDHLMARLLVLLAAVCFFLAAFFLLGGTTEELGILVNYLVFGEEGENFVSASPLTLTVIDVGQSSSALLQSGESAVLIDCGEKASSGAIMATLEDAGVRKLDAVVITHLHADHYGAAADVIKNLAVDEIIIPDTPEELVPTTRAFEALLDVIEGSGAKVTICTEVMERVLSGGAKIRFLDGFLERPEDLNNTSLTMRIDYGDASFLITGDAEVEIEDKLRENRQPIDVDVLVVGHHGSATSSRQYFLNEVTPVVSVISVGEDNSYNLPNEKALKRISEFGPIYRTDINGSVTFETDGYTIEVSAKNILDSFAA